MSLEHYAETGIQSGEELSLLLKALTAPEGMGEFQTGLGAQTPQSLEGTLVSLTAQMKHFTLYNDLPKDKAFSTVEEFSARIGVGINEGGWVGQMENPEVKDPDYVRKYSVVKFLREMWEAGSVASYVKTIVPSEVEAKQAAMIRLIRRFSGTLYTGDDSLVATEINGFARTIESEGSPDHTIDLGGNYPTQDHFNNAAQLLHDNFGIVENATLYTSSGGLNALSGVVGKVAGANTILRAMQGQVGSDGRLNAGFRIGDIYTNHGTIRHKTDLFLGMEYENRTVPKIRNASGQLVEGPTSQYAPPMPSITVTVNGPTPGSKWMNTGRARPSGNIYRYRVTARNRFGRSVACAAVAMPAAVPDGGSVSIEITPGSGTYPAECYEILSEKDAGSGIFRIVDKIPANGVNPVTFVDMNIYIPGTSRFFYLDFTSIGSDRSYLLKQLAPIHNEPLAKLGPSTRGLINYYVTPQYYAPRKFIQFINVPIEQYGYDERIML